MKFKHLLYTLLASILVFVGCVEEVPSLSNITLSKSYIGFGLEGGTQNIEIDAKVDWEFDAEILRLNPWLEVSPSSFKAGKAIIRVTTEKTQAPRKVDLLLHAGDEVQRVLVSQSTSDVKMSTCKDVIDGPDGAVYLVKGVCKEIQKADWGNWIMKDDTGEILIYGTLDADGQKRNFMSLGIEEGDSVTVSGQKKIYNNETIELTDVTVVPPIVKSKLLIKNKDIRIKYNAGETYVMVKSPVGLDTENLKLNFIEGGDDWLAIDHIEAASTDEFKILVKYTENLDKTPRKAELSVSTGNLAEEGKPENILKTKASIFQLFDYEDETKFPRNDVKEAYNNLDKYVKVEGRVAAICHKGYILRDKEGNDKSSIFVTYSKYGKTYRPGDLAEVVARPSNHDFTTVFYNPEVDLIPKGGRGDGKYTEHPAPEVMTADKLKEIVAKCSPEDSKEILPIKYIEVEGQLVKGKLILDGLKESDGNVGLYYIHKSFNINTKDDSGKKRYKAHGYTTSFETKGNTLNLVVSDIEDITPKETPEK